MGHLQVFGDRCNDVAVTAGDRRQHDLGIAFLHYAAIFREQLVGTHAFVNEGRRDLDAIDAASGIQLLDIELGRGLGRDTEHRSRPGQKGGDADLQLSRFGLRECAGHRNGGGGAGQQTGKGMQLHGYLLLPGRGWP